MTKPDLPKKNDKKR